jgi:ribosomal protein S12 methylthiotransferase
LIEKLKIEIPAIVLRTTFLVGHPGETKNDFADLKTFVREMEFDRVGVFTFSKEEGTISATLPDQVDEKLALDRKNELLEIQQKISLKKNKQWIGKTVKTLIEGPSKESDLLWQGRFYGQAPEIDGVILINKGTAEIGSFAQVKITDAFEYDLLGEIFSQSLSENAQIQGASKRTTGAYTKST